MSAISLVHSGEDFEVPIMQAISKCGLFQKDPTHLVSPYRVQSPVSSTSFHEFLSALRGNAIKITDANVTELQCLCEEFRFVELATKIVEFRATTESKEAEDPLARARVAALEERTDQQDRELTVLHAKLTEICTNFERLGAEVSALRCGSTGIQTLSAEVSGLKTGSAQKQSDAVVEELSTALSKLGKEVTELRMQTTEVPRTAAAVEEKLTQLATQFEQLSAEVSAQRTASAEIAIISEEISALKAQVAAKQSDAALEKLPNKFQKLRKKVSGLKAQVAQKQNDPIVPSMVTNIGQLTNEVSNLKTQMAEKQKVEQLAKELSELRKDVLNGKTQMAEKQTVEQLSTAVTEMRKELSGFRPSALLKEAEDAEGRGRIAEFEEKANRQDDVIATLQQQVTQQSRNSDRAGAELAAFKTQMAQKANAPVVEKLATDFDGLRKELSTLKAQSSAIPREIANLQQQVTQQSRNSDRVGTEVAALRSATTGIERMTAEVSALKTQIAQKPNASVAEKLTTDFDELRKDVSAMKTKIARMLPLPFDSRIISDFPEIFAEFRWNQFSLLWRGSSDGFGAKEFHGRCDGHANTLTVILDTEGNIFGGFTPVEWESGEWHSKADDSQKSFLFTLMNPHNIPARRFVLEAEDKQWAIGCDSGWGPCFGSNGIYVSDNCHANTHSVTCLGRSYTNDTGLDEKIVFTGSWKFQVKEIELFEITA
jgi:uncharacterized coiled-coil protein SlyX